MVSATRSARDTLSKKTPPTTPIAGSRKSERLEKKISTPPSLAAPAKVNSTKKNTNEKSSAVLATPLRRSERTNKSISSPASSSTSSPSKCSNLKSSASTPKKKREFVEEKEVSEDEEEERDFGSSSKLKKKRLNALVYRAGFSKPEADCLEESNKMDKSNREGVKSGGGKLPEDMVLSDDAKAKEATAESRFSEPVNELIEDNVTNDTHYETSEAPEMDQSDCCGEETSCMLRAKSGLNEPVKEISENNATLGSLVPSNDTNNETSQAPDNGENLISPKRKGTMMDMHSDVSTTLVDDENCNAIADADPSKLCGSNVGTKGSCSKRIRRISFSDAQSDQRKLINNADQLSPKSEDVKLSKENEEERPQGNDVEHLRKQQRSLHLSLKPKIARLCEILHLPDNVKNMVDNCLEYIMNNRQICTEPVTLFQAFQLSLCWIAASLLQYKLDFEVSVKLAKRHLNFTCKKDVVNVIYTRLWELKEEILFHAGNPVVSDSPKAYESSNSVNSCTEVPPIIELADPKNTKEIQKCENQLGKVLQMQQEETQKLKADIEKEKADFVRRYQIEWAAIQHCSPSDTMRRERLKFFKNEYGKRYEELKRQHEKRLKDLNAVQVDRTRKCGESREQGALLIPDASKELETGIEDLQTCGQAQPQNGPNNVACVSDHVTEGKSFDNIVEAMTRAGTGVGSSKSPGTSSPVVVLCSSPVELQTPLGKHAAAKEMAIMASEDEPVSRNKCHSINENEYGRQGNIIPKHSNSREASSGVAANTTDEGDGCGTFSRESHNDCGQDTEAVVLLSSNGDISDQETSYVPNGEAALLMSKTSNLNEDQEVPSSSQGKLDRTILRKPDCGLSVEVKEGFRDGVKNKASPNSQSSVEPIPNCENAAQIHEVDNNDPYEVDNNGSNNSETPKLPPSDERPCGGAINRSVLDKELSGPCGTASPNDGSGDNATSVLNQDPLEKQNPDGDSSSIPAEQITVEVLESGHEEASVSVSDRESPAGMPSTVSCQDHPENVTPLDPSFMDQISDGGSVLDGNLPSRSCGTSSPSNGLAIPPLNPPSSQQPDRVPLNIPADQIPVIVPETSHEVAECQLTDIVMLDRNTISDQQEGVQRTIPESTSTQEAPVSRPASHTKSPEQVQPLSPVQSPNEPDTARETQNSSVSGPVDIVPANQSNHVSLAVEPPVQVQQLTCDDLSCNQDLPSLPSATGIEHQQTNEDTHSNHIAEASIEVPNQDVEQHASNLELDSRSHRVVQTAPNLDRDSPMPVGVRTQPSDTRNLSTTNQPIQTATQSASRSAPPLFRDPLKNEMERIRKLVDDNVKTHEDKKLQFKTDFEKEFEELRNKYKVKLHDTEVEFQQQWKELDKKFKTVLANKALADAFRYKCLDHKASSTSAMYQDPSFAQQLFQHVSHQLSTWPPPVAGAPSCGPPAASMPSFYTTSSSNVVPPPLRPHTTSSSQTMVPPPPRTHTTNRSQPVVPSSPRPPTTSSSQRVVPPPLRPYTTTSSQPVVQPAARPTYNTSAIFSPVSARLSHNNPIPPTSGNFQAGGEMRSPAPHLQAYRPSMSVPPPTSSPAPHLQACRPSTSLPASTNLCTAPPGMPSQPASINFPLNTPSFSRQHPSPLLRPNQPQPASAGGLPAPNLTSTNLRIDASSQSGIIQPNILPRVSDLAKLNLPRAGTSSSKPANSPLQDASSDVVCLSDDE